MFSTKYKFNHKEPDYSFESVNDITPEVLQSIGAEAVAIDLDDTMVKNMSYSMPHKSREWVKSLKKKGIKVIIVSNTFVFRALYLSSKIGYVPFVPLAGKPLPFALQIASEILHINMDKIAMIGDKFDKDIISANRAGAISIKVEGAPV